MNTNENCTGAGILWRHKRYVLWFYLLNLLLGHWGAHSYSMVAHEMLDHSLHARQLVNGFDIATFVEMFVRPDFGPAAASTGPAVHFALAFLLLNIVFMPGVFWGFASAIRIPRGEFFRACGRNLWRFVRLVLFFVLIAVIVGGILFGIFGAMTKHIEKSTPERLPFFIQLAGMILILIILTKIRAWFDLAQTDVVVGDQRKVRSSMARGWRMMRGSRIRLLARYVGIAIVALIVLACGLLLWNKLVPPASVFGAFVISQITLFVLLAMRFWQRACAVSFYLKQKALEPPAVVVVETPPLTPEPPTPAAVEPLPPFGAPTPEAGI